MGWTPRQLLEFVRNRAPEDFPKIEHKYPLTGGPDGTIVGKLCSVAINSSAYITVKDERDGVMRGFFSNPDEENVQILETYLTIQTPPSFESGTCPKCGDRGEWRGLALVCRGGHGVFAG